MFGYQNYLTGEMVVGFDSFDSAYQHAADNGLHGVTGYRVVHVAPDGGPAATTARSGSFAAFVALGQ